MKTAEARDQKSTGLLPFLHFYFIIPLLKKQKQKLIRSGEQIKTKLSNKDGGGN
jgi:hypothetical protein